MKKLFQLILFFLLVIPLSNAYKIEKYELYFNILENLDVKEEISILFQDELNETTLTYLVSGNVLDLKINSLEKELDYELKKIENEYQIKIFVPEKTKQISISFISRDLVFTKDNNYNFFTVFNPPKDVNEINIKINLPKGYAAYKESIFPINPNMSTDGEKIFFLWTLKNKTDEIPISIKFYNPYHQQYKNEIILLIFLIPISIIIYIISFYKKRIKEEFLKGFTDDEAKVIKYLAKRKISYQNRIEKEFGFSRAKMTRIVKKLEAKKLIEKSKIGRTNKIFWKK